MGQPTPTSIKDLETEISLVMPTALDIIAEVVADPGMTLERYETFLTLAEANPGTLFLALLRVSAGLAAIADMTPDQIRDLGATPADTTPAE